MIFKVPPIPNHSMILWLNSTAFHWIRLKYKRLKSSMVKFLCMQGSVPASLRASKRKDHCSPSACTSEKSQGFLSSVKDYSKTGGGAKQSSPGLVILSGVCWDAAVVTRLQHEMYYCSDGFSLLWWEYLRFRQVESFQKSLPLNVTPPDTFPHLLTVSETKSVLWLPVAQSKF